MIQLVETPPRPLDGQNWVATEAPTNFRFLRNDYTRDGEQANGDYLQLTLNEQFNGQEGDAITVHCTEIDGTTMDAMFVGTVTGIDSAYVITTDILWQTGFVWDYMNDDSERAGYFFEARLTVNNVVQALTVMASPDTYGYANLDVSGLLRIMVALGKNEDSYDDYVVTETGKGGSFTLEYREVWYGTVGQWTAEDNLWGYVEAVRSIEQGSDMSEFVAFDANEGKFLNAFAVPVFFTGLPFDISAIMTQPHQTASVTAVCYSAAGIEVGRIEYNWGDSVSSGRVVSLFINPAEVNNLTSYIMLYAELYND